MILVRQCGKIQLTWLENICGVVLHRKGACLGKFVSVFIFVILIMINNSLVRNFKYYRIYH